MSEIFSVQLTAAATLALGVLAFATAIFAGLAFLKQSREVKAIERQVADGQEVGRQQAELIKIQTGQLEAVRGQLEVQRQASAAQAEVLRLQAAELRESLEERKREAEDRRRSQAAGVTVWLDQKEIPSMGTTPVGAMVANTSGQPVFDVRVFFHQINRRPGEDWVPVVLGSPPPDQTLPVIPAATEHFVPMPPSLMGMFGDIQINPATVIVSVEFTDTAGNRWERDPRGALNTRS